MSDPEVIREIAVRGISGGWCRIDIENEIHQITLNNNNSKYVNMNLKSNTSNVVLGLVLSINAYLNN